MFYKYSKKRVVFVFRYAWWGFLFYWTMFCRFLITCVVNKRCTQFICCRLMVLNNEKDVLVKKKFILQFAKEDDIRTTEIFSQRWNICFYYQSYQRVNFLKHCMFIGICWYKIRRTFSLSANSEMKYCQDFKKMQVKDVKNSKNWNIFSIFYISIYIVQNNALF